MLCFVLFALAAPVWGWNTPKISNEKISVSASVITSLRELSSRPVVVIFHQGAQNVEPYITHALNSENVANDFWLLKVNSTGSTDVLAKSSSDREKFVELVRAAKTGDVIGEEVKEGSALFYGVLKAVQEVPYGSGLMIFADRKIVDEDLVHIVHKEISRKNIKLITIWLGLYPTLSGEERLLQEVSLISGGVFLVGDNKHLMRKDYIEKLHNGQTESIIAHMEKLRGNRKFDVVVDNGVAALHVFLSGDVQQARLFSPNGYLVDLTSAESVERYSRESYAVVMDGVHEILLNTARKASSDVVGTWRLQIDASDGDDAVGQGYNFTIFIENNLVLTTETAVLNKNQDKSYSLKLWLKGAFNSINNITLKDKYGSILKPRLNYTFMGDKRYEIMEANSAEDKIINVTLNDIRKPVLIQVNGKDLQGNNFVRMNLINPIITNRQLQPISIEVGTGSQLIISPNQQTTIYFEVTNNLPQVTYVNFLCKDSNAYLYRMMPLRSRLNSYETIIVSVVVIAGANIATDLITLTANSNLGQYQKSVMLNVDHNRVKDRRDPNLIYSYPEDCTSVFFGRCENGYWRIEVTAQDRDSGLKHLLSNPPSLYFPQNYITGTKESVTGYYSGSCCEPKIEIVAIDLMNNRISYQPHAYYTPGGIGIICGLILLIILVIAIIVVSVLKCVKCKRKQKDSMDIPPVQYRGPVNSKSTRRY